MSIEKKTVWLEDASGNILCGDKSDKIVMIGDRKHPPFFVIKVNGNRAYVGSDIRRLRKLRKLLDFAIDVLED